MGKLKHINHTPDTFDEWKNILDSFGIKIPPKDKKGRYVVRNNIGMLIAFWNCDDEQHVKNSGWIDFYEMEETDGNKNNT